LWKNFSEGKRPELVTQLSQDMAPDRRSTYILGVTSSMLYEQRVGIIEALLRDFSAFEMSSFVDFLPYIWEGLSVQYANKILLRMSPSDRSRIVSQMVALEAARATAPDAAGSDPSDQSAKLHVSPDPSNKLPSELPGWMSLGPSASGGTNYDLATVLAISAECLELAATHFAARHGAEVEEEVLVSRASQLPWPRFVFNVLLRRCIPPPKPGLSSTQCAREALWAFLTALRTFAKSNPRAKLLARLCGVMRYEYHPARVACALRVLAFIPPGTGTSTLSLEADAWLPMQQIGDAPRDPRGLPALLRSAEMGLGAHNKVMVLIERLEAAAVEDPRPKPLAVTVINVDTALMAIIDAFDTARVKRATQLAALHEQLEVARGASALDATAFCSALRGFDATLNERAAIAVFTDCELAAAEEHLISGSSRGSKPVDGTAEDAANAKAIPRHVFIRICEEHRLRRTKETE